ncbi:MAG TPA: mechanosensitive ion channel family protein, partial [Blastocatellia bacterium]|nr:mechanosensitive ion channel family protein [Blastocatellia bacterium]
FVLTLLKYALLIFGAVVALQQLNINLTSIVASLGVIGLSIGLAAKDSLSNVIGGVFIFWDKPFVIGDLIEAGDEYGEVRAITLRSTRIITPDGKVVSIPNSVTINNKIKCYTMEPHLRVDVDVSAPLTLDVDEARKRILSSVVGDQRFLETPAPALVVTKVDPTAMNLQLRVWLSESRKHLEVAGELRERAKNLIYFNMEQKD